MQGFNSGHSDFYWHGHRESRVRAVARRRWRQGGGRDNVARERFRHHKYNQEAGQMAVSHHGRRYDNTRVFQIPIFQIPSQISILNLKSQPKSKFGQI